MTGATGTKGSLSSSSQCSTQCEHLHVTSHEPATQLTEPVSAVNRPREKALWASSQGLALARKDDITHWSSILSSPRRCLPIFTRGLKWAFRGRQENTEERAVCFLLCVNNTTSVPQPGSWTKVKWCELSLPAGSEGGEWEKEGGGCGECQGAPEQ